MKNQSGFSFLELIVAVAIMAVLATIVGVRVIPHLAKGKITAAKTQIENFRTALRLYSMDAQRLPTQEQGLQALVDRPTSSPLPVKYAEGGYLEQRSVPVDPWGNAYIYLVPGPDGAAFVVMSYGADGEPGGEGDAADLTSMDQ